MTNIYIISEWSLSGATITVLGERIVECQYITHITVLQSEDTFAGSFSRNEIFPHFAHNNIPGKWGFFSILLFLRNLILFCSHVELCRISFCFKNKTKSFVFLHYLWIIICEFGWIYCQISTRWYF